MGNNNSWKSGTSNKNLYFNFFNLHISWICTPTSFTILNELSIFSLNDSRSMSGIVKDILFF